VDKGTGTGAITLNMNDGNVQHMNNSGVRAITLSNPNNGGTYVLSVEAIASANSAWTWTTTVEWVGGAVPSLTTTTGRRDVIYLLYTDGTWHGNYSLDHN